MRHKRIFDVEMKAPNDIVDAIVDPHSFLDQIEKTFTKMIECSKKSAPEHFSPEEIQHHLDELPSLRRAISWLPQAEDEVPAVQG